MQFGLFLKLGIYLFYTNQYFDEDIRMMSKICQLNGSNCSLEISS